MKKQILNISKTICKNNNLELNPEDLSTLIAYQLLQNPFYKNKYDFVKLGMSEKNNVFLYNDRYEGNFLTNLSISSQKINFGEKNEKFYENDFDNNLKTQNLFDLLNEEERIIFKSFLDFLTTTCDFNDILNYFETKKNDFKKINYLLNYYFEDQNTHLINKDSFHLLTIINDIIYHNDGFSLDGIYKHQLKKRELRNILDFSKKIKYFEDLEEGSITDFVKLLNNEEFYQLISLGNENKIFKPKFDTIEQRMDLLKKIKDNKNLYDNSLIKTLSKDGGALKNIYNDFFLPDQKNSLIKKIKSILSKPSYEFYFGKYNKYVKLGVEKILEKRPDFNHFKIERFDKKESFFKHLNKKVMTLNLFDSMEIELKLSGFENFSDYAVYAHEGATYFYAHDGKEVLGILKLNEDEYMKKENKKAFSLVVVNFNKKCNNDEEITKELLHQAYGYIEKEKAYLHIDFLRDKVIFLRSISDKMIDNYNIVYDFQRNINASVRELLEIEIRNKIIDESTEKNINYDDTLKEIKKTINFLNKENVDESVSKYDKEILISMANELIDKSSKIKEHQKIKIKK